MAIFSYEYAVLLDCEVFDAVRLDFDNRNLAHLAELARSGQVHMLVTSVIVDEVKSHIAKEAQRIGDQLETIAANALVRGSDLELTKLRTDASFPKKISDAAVKRFESFLKHSRATVLAIDTVSAAGVFADYFGSQPPFGTGKKKAEFPDAFTLHALRAWAADKKHPVVVISNDGDLKAFCDVNPPLRVMTSLTTFLAIFPDAEISQMVRDWLDGQWAAIDEIVADQLRDISFMLEGTDGRIDGVIFDSMDVLDYGIVEIEKGAARISAHVDVKFEADIYAYPIHWYPRGDDDRPWPESGSVIDYIEMWLDIVVTLDAASNAPVEIDHVDIVDSSVARIRVPHDWQGGRYR